MQSIYAQSNIRAQLSILSNPPVAPLDINTGLAPQFWRGASIEIDIGIFDGSQQGLDLSNLTSLQLTLFPSPTSLVPWLTKTIPSGAGIVSPIDFGDWEDGLTQNARFILAPSDTDLGLLAGASRQFWMTITGFTNASGIIVYGAGYVTIYNAGSIYPPPAGGVVSWHAQTNAAGNSSVTPTGLLHTEEISFTGGAGTRNIVLAAAGYPQGAQVEILALLPNLTPGIVINVYSNSLTGSPILTYTTDAFQPNVLFKAVVNGTAGYDGVELIAPAFL